MFIKFCGTGIAVTGINIAPIGIEKFPAAVLCFGLNSGAYVSEIIRGGIMSVDIGQTEAGRSLGFGYGATMFHIVMPQAFKAVLPALCNEFITLLKETSVAFYIGVADLTRAGIKIRSITYSNFMPLVAVALVYLVLVLILTKLVGTMPFFNTKTLTDYFKGLYVTRVKDRLSSCLVKSKISILEINSHLDEISAELESQLRDEFAQFGIRVASFYVNDIYCDG